MGAAGCLREPLLLLQTLIWHGRLASKKKTIYLLLCTIDKSPPITGTFFFIVHNVVGKMFALWMTQWWFGACQNMWSNAACQSSILARVCFSCGCCCGSRDDRTARDWVWSRRIDKLFQLTGACNWLSGADTTVRIVCKRMYSWRLPSMPSDLRCHGEQKIVLFLQLSTGWKKIVVFISVSSLSPGNKFK